MELPEPVTWPRIAVPDNGVDTNLRDISLLQ
jgi:hypothetical protein